MICGTQPRPMTESEVVNHLCPWKVMGDFCVGSRCMAWRWDLERVDLTPEEISAAGMAIAVAAALQPETPTKRGHCGNIKD